MKMESTFKFDAKLRAHFIALASAWKGRVVLTLLKQANPTFPLQSLAKVVMDELSRLQVASTLILTESLSGFDQAD